MAERFAPSIEHQAVPTGQSSLTRDPEQAYYDAIVSCNDKLATTLSLEPLSIAAALLARGIIPENTEAEMRNPFYTPLQKASILLAAVRSKVKVSPRSLHEFIAILSQQPWARDAAEALHAAFLRSTHTFNGSDNGYNYSSIYTDYLKSLYATLCPTQMSSLEQWPPSSVDKVFRLTMIVSEKGMNENQPFVTEVNIDHVSLTKISVELQDILNQPLIRGKRRVVLIEGAPGSGKSTLSIHIGQQWGEGKLFQGYRIVILVILRDPEVRNATSIIDLLPCRNRQMAERAFEEITNADGQGVLWVLDGWDEVSAFLPHNHIIRKLVQPELSTKSPLYKSDVIITSRPISIGGLQRFVSHRFEILGFTPSEQERYFNECLHGDAEAFIDTIKKYPAVAGSCYLPLNASIYAHLYKCRADSLPTTQYEIFSSLICNCILRYCKKQGYPEISSIGSLNEIPNILKESFSKLCELAYNGVMEDTFIFTLSSSFDTLGLLRGMESLSRAGMEYTYSFIHMAIQELLAALHMALTMTPAEQETTFRKLFHNPRFSAMLQHFAAITKLNISGLKDTVASIVQWYANRQTFEDESLLLALLNCAFEAQDRNLCEVICKEIGSDITFGNEYTLTPIDCNSIGYFISQVCVIHEGKFRISIMNHSIIDEHGWKFLADSFCRSLDPYSFITASLHLIAICNGLTRGDIIAVHRAFAEANLNSEGHQRTLHEALEETSSETEQTAVHGALEEANNETDHTVLHEALEETSDDGEKTTRTVTETNSDREQTAVHGASKETNNETDRTDNLPNVKNQIVEHVSKIIKESYAVTILNLSMIGFTAKCCKHLSEAMMENTSVEILHISFNLIEDEGIQLLAPFLEENTTLKEFYLQYCGITGFGIKFLVKSLKWNTTLQVLDIEGNPWLKLQGLEEVFHFLSYNETTALSKIIVSPEHIPPIRPAVTLLDQIRAEANLHDILFSGDGNLYCMMAESTKGKSETAVQEQESEDILSLGDSLIVDLHTESLHQVQSVPNADTAYPVGINGGDNPKEFLKTLYLCSFPPSQLSQASKMIITQGESDLEIKPDNLQDIVMKSKLVLIQGIQGSGKTTTSVYICQQWASGAHFSNFELVILVQLQDPLVQQATRLADIIPSQSDAAAQLLAAKIEAKMGQRILWIFDGWHDLPGDIRENCNLHALIVASQNWQGPLGRSAVIVTSQPLSARDSLIGNIRCRVKLDFSSQQMEKHIMENLASDRIISTEMLEKVNGTFDSALADIQPTLLTANLLANMFKHCQHFIPATTCTTYYYFLKVIMVCMSHQSELIGCNSLEDIPENLKDPLRIICELAYSSLMKERSSFSLPQNFETLGLLQSTKCFTRPRVNTVVHKFIHLTVQQILAARFIALQSPKEQATIVKQLFSQAHNSSQLSLVLYHYATMTKLKLSPVKAAIKELILACLPKSKDVEDKSTSLTDSEKKANKERLLALICSLYSAQDPLLCQLVASTLKYNLDLSFLSLSHSNVDCLIFFLEAISTKDRFKLSLNSCSLDRKMCENLLMKLCATPSSTKIDLNLSFQIKIGLTSFMMLAEGQIVDSTYFADQIAPPIARCLKEGNLLQHLNISVNGLSPNGARLLSSGLIQNTSLLELDLNYCSVGDKGVQYIFQALEKNQTLLSLDMQGCRITDVGVRFIARALRSNKALEYLDISVNGGITTQGLSAITVCLRSLENTTLQSIYFPMHLEEPVKSASSSINEIREAKNLTNVLMKASDVIHM